MSSIYGPNAKYYLKGLEAAFANSEKDRVQREKRPGQAKSIYNMGQKAYNYFNTPGQAAFAPNVAMPASNITGAGAELAATAVPETFVSTAAPVMGPTVEAAATLAPAAEAAVAGGTAAAEAGTAAASTGAAAGTATSAMASTGVGAIIAAGLAVGSAKPGDALFGVKKHMYGPLSQVYKYGMGGGMLDKWLGAYSPQNLVNSVFGDPYQQEREKRQQEADKNRIVGLRTAFNMQKAIDPLTGQDNDIEPERKPGTY
jgi:hypothetical protein